MKFLTLNLNSIRVRKDSIDWLIKHEDPDVMFFQELKCSTDLFPYDFFKDTEYKHFAVIGQKSYNGVAIVSKHELHNIKTQFENNSVPDEARFISAEILSGYGDAPIYLSHLGIKTNNNGEEQWSQTFGGAGDDTAQSIQQTSDGGYIIAAHTSTTNNISNGIYLIKTDAQGNTPSTNITELPTINKSLIKKIDILGRATNNNKGFQLHIFDDGSIEKKHLIK